MAVPAEKISISGLVLKRWIESKKAKIRIWPCHVNRASSLGHPCERYLVYCRTAWNKKAPYDWELQVIFDEGNRQEKAVEEDLRDAGFNLIEQQRPFEMKELLITGHIDGKILLENRGIPYEAKSMSPHIWHTVQSIQDMLDHKYAYMRKYPAQMNLYLLMDNKDYGIFILKNKSTGMWRILDVYLDYEYAESLLKKAERINAHCKKNTLPEHIQDMNVCQRCEFRHICLPDMGGVEFTDGKIIDLLDERHDLIDLIDKSPIPDCQKRLKEINELLRMVFKDRSSVIAGPYLITGKWAGNGSRRYWKLNIVSSNIPEAQ